MALLTFVLGDHNFELTPTKIERDKLVGKTEKRVIDQDGAVCRQASLDQNGVTIIPNKASQDIYLLADGSWMDKSEEITCNPDGSPVVPVPSSFKAPLQLLKKATEEDLLNCLVASVYQLDGEEAATLAATIGNNIYSFPFAYTSTSAEYSDGFLLSNGSSLFLLTGETAKFEFIGLDEQAVLEETPEDEQTDIEDLDFSF